MSLRYAFSDLRKGVLTLKTVQVKCDHCGRTFQKMQIEMREHNFCCRDHFYHWNAKRVSVYNSTENPMNKPGGVMESRLRRGDMLRGSGEGKAYRKRLGRHEHRRVAETKLGRPLKKGEVVHHIDGNKLNNSIENIMVLESQAEHARIHALESRFGKSIGKCRKGGDAQ